MQHRLGERAQGTETERERERKNSKETYLRFHQNALGMSRLGLLLLRSPSDEDKASPTLDSSTPLRTCSQTASFR